MKFGNQIIEIGTTLKTVKELADVTTVQYLNEQNLLDSIKDNSNLYITKSPEGVIYLDKIAKSIIVFVKEEDLEYNIKVLTKSLVTLIKSQQLSKIYVLEDNDLSDSATIIMINALCNSAYSFSLREKNEDESITILVENIKDSTSNNNIKTTINTSKNKTMVRDIVNTPPNLFIPETMLEVIRNNFSDNKDFKIEVIKDRELLKENMNLFYSVGKASIHPGMLIHLTYKPTFENTNRKKISLVGKGLTYDSGGLSIKSSESMTDMKSDKAGAATVFGVMKNLQELKPDVEVHAIFAMSENVIDGSAYKPDDVITSKNGITVEIKNTDAEGRLVLADSLSYIQEKEPDLDYIIDFATLTGAAVVALGEFTFAIIGNNKELQKDFEKASIQSSEYSNILNFNKLLDKTLKSEIADISNISSTRYGGALTAGLFLNRFINDSMKDKWLHIDIAGPAFTSVAWEDKPKGATGTSVDTVTTWILSKQ